MLVCGELGAGKALHRALIADLVAATDAAPRILTQQLRLRNKVNVKTLLSAKCAIEPGGGAAAMSKALHRACVSHDSGYVRLLIDAKVSLDPTSSEKTSMTLTERFKARPLLELMIRQPRGDRAKDLKHTEIARLLIR